MKFFKFTILLIAAVSFSIAGCKKENNPPASSGGGGGGSSPDCCVCTIAGFDIVQCEEDYTAEEWNDFMANFECDCSSNGVGYECESGNCITTTTGADFNSLQDCEDACGGSSDSYECISGNCFDVGSGGSYNTLADCEANCASTSTYLVPSSGDNSINTCDGVIKDHAGDGNYENNIDGYTVINPGASGFNIQLTFSSFQMESVFDFVIVYDGAGTSGTELFNGSGNTLPPTITASNGPVTIRMTSDGSFTQDGFAANITCVPQ